MRSVPVRIGADAAAGTARRAGGATRPRRGIRSARDRGGRDGRMEPMALHITGDPAADELLSTDAFALLTGMLLDQQVAMETAFAGPLKISERAGSIAPDAVAGYDPERFVEVFKQTPAVHRYPGSMAARVQALAQAVVDDWGGDASAIWTQGDPDGADDPEAAQGAAGLRRPEGADLPGAARQADGARGIRMARGRRLLRRGGKPPLGRRHRRPRLARPRARDEAGREGRGQGREVGRSPGACIGAVRRERASAEPTARALGRWSWG